MRLATIIRILVGGFASQGESLDDLRTEVRALSQDSPYWDGMKEMFPKVMASARKASEDFERKNKKRSLAIVKPIGLGKNPKRKAPR